MGESVTNVEAGFRFLEPDEGVVLSEAIRIAYGDSYDVRWVYAKQIKDAENVARSARERPRTPICAGRAALKRRLA